MGKSVAASNSLLNLIFNATAWANIADNAAVSPATNLYIALHTADPGSTGTQNTNEASYIGYARVPVPRTSGGWTTSTVAATSPRATITFPGGLGGLGIATFASIGMLPSGPGIILYSGPISPPITLGNGFTPQLTSASVVTEA